MLFYIIEKSFLFVLTMVLLSLLMIGADFRSAPSATFIYPEMDTLYNCFSEVFVSRLKTVNTLVAPFDFLRNTVLYDILSLSLMRFVFLVYGHPHILLQVLLLGVSFGYAMLSMLRRSMFSLKSAVSVLLFSLRLLKYLTVFLFFQCFCDLIYLTACVLLLWLFVLGIRFAVIFFVA